MDARSSATRSRGLIVVLLGLASGCSTEPPDVRAAFESLSSSVSGAIFTTTQDGDRVNANLYERKEHVYLDGGPGVNAPIGAAGLPAGDYFFQVTDPSGQDLLSSDHVSCRRVRVNALGVIDHSYPGTNYVRSGNAWVASPCQHRTGLDVDHDATTVQLHPYDDTPNRGGVYKVWMTPVEDYTGDPSFVPVSRRDAVNGEDYEAGNFHGFVPRFCKTDNFKVRLGRVRPPSEIALRKFHDANADGVQDAEESDVSGWLVHGVDPLGATNDYYTPASILASMGIWGFVEDVPAGAMPTVVTVDGNVASAYPDADPFVSLMVQSDWDEQHTIVYGNVGLGQVTACKVFDRDGDGIDDLDEPGVAGWPMTLTGTDARGTSVGPTTQRTGEGGCTTFGSLLPGTYTVTEGSGGGTWTPTGSTSESTTVTSMLDGSTITGSSSTVAFTNVCTATADFGTKGYWHNKNGIAELTAGDIAAVNAMIVYASASSYFGAGDEPFDGSFADGTPVAAAMGVLGEVLAPAGSTNAEVSAFLVDANATGDPREQLAQQLLAFVFNVRHRLDGGDAMILVNGSWVSAGSLIDQAVAAWSSGSADDQHALESILDALNNADALPYVPQNACAVQ